MSSKMELESYLYTSVNFYWIFHKTPFVDDQGVIPCLLVGIVSSMPLYKQNRTVHKENEVRSLRVDTVDYENKMS